MTEPNSSPSTDELLAREYERYRDRTPNSAEMAEELREVVPAGVCSTFRAYEPYPIHADRAAGTTIYDVDGNELLDFALNNGTQLVGHTHPELDDAVVEQIDRGTLYTRPSDRLEFAAQPLIDRWDAIEQVRFTNSGTEAVMHATRLARAYTGREKVIRMEGAYHGAHDPALVSKMPPLEQAGPADDPRRVRESQGVPESVPEDVLLAQYNDAESVEALLREHGPEVAAILVEPACLNLGLAEPEDGFLERLRELADEYNVVLLFDEVKTGVKLAPGGGAEYYGVEPDIVALAKAIGGGYPVGAFGGRREIMERIAADLDDGVATGAAHYGTYNGNPLVLCAVGVTLREILTEDAYDHVSDLNERLAAGYRDVIEDAGLEAQVKTAGSQGAVHFTDEPIRTFRDWQHVDEEFHEAYWIGMVNRDVVPHPHDASQQWTISVQHTAEEIDAHVEAFADLATHLFMAQQ
ncbi:aspartate aminotransferase family protein [Natrarchaeobius chitinivorans]|uniref:Glutamate-1-semialdehyde 2,1-aminomutase n=1 Tax=Natrarchaeobius chitinivorans TaxID=1679083 RepID=A0A3N6P2V7_NATCH|nr:aspartate aminotransferase family protein [Natrarchaeobius chitinivorans]RQG91959.1 aspartate aminotransferase family protein [Natrarchaeobius chitinivorans]